MKSKLSKADLRQAHQIGGLKTQSKFRFRDISEINKILMIMGLAIVILGIGVIMALIK